jgi:spore maturation protein CgeB
MSQLRILFFQPDYSCYHSAYYQNHFLTALRKIHDVFTYGPGYPGYDSTHTIRDVLELCPFEPHLICFGYGWERDDHPTEFNPHPAIKVADVGIPSVMALNKEYKKLDQKFQFIIDNNIQIVFTAHHHHAKWEKQVGVRFLHFPFAIFPALFRDYGGPKKYDFGFSGSLHTEWTDVRLRIKRKLFWVGRHKRPRYWRLRLYWGEWGSGHKRGEDYPRLINSSRTWLATPSAIDLVGTRFYEIMALKSLLLCSRSSVYDGLFEQEKHCIMFEPDLSDFDQKLFYYLKNEQEREAVIERAYRHVHENHTWEKRVEQFTKAVYDLLFEAPLATT